MRWIWWAISAGAALLAASQWLHAPSVDYLVPMIVATVAAIATAIYVRGGPRWWAAGTAIGLAISTGLAIPAQRDLWRINEAFARFNLAACIKAGLQIQGYAVGDPVPPQAALAPAERDAVEHILADVAKLEMA